MPRFLLFSLFMLLITSHLFAQSTGKIAGRITDSETGEALPGANVTLEETNFGSSAGLDGQYVILNVPPGVYEVRASFVGYKDILKSNVRVTPGLTTRLNFELEATTIEGEVIEVVVERPIVNLTATNAVRNMDREEFENIATRNTQKFYAIQPGVTVQNREVYIRGGRSDETDYVLENASIRSLIGTDDVVNVIPEALEQIQVHAGGYSAEMGGANAGIIQQTLRTGGSKYSGSAQYETDGVAPVDYGYNRITATAGGPILNKKHRFFVAFENTSTDNYNPMFWEGADFGYLVDDGGAGGTVGDTSVAPVRWGDDNLPGSVQRPEDRLSVNGTLLFDFNPIRFRLGFAQTNRDRRINNVPIYNMFNQERLPQRDDLRRLLSLRATYFLSKNTFIEAQVSRFNYEFETYDPNFSKPSADGNGGAVLDLLDYIHRDAVGAAGLDTSAFKGAYTPPSNYSFSTFEFQRPGDVATTYQKRQQSYYDISLDAVSQREQHEIKFGGKYRSWTARNYVFGEAAMRALGTRISQGETVMLDGEEVSYEEAVARGAGNVAADIRRANGGGYGYDEFMNEVDSGPDGAKNPVITSLYINDKIEFSDIIVNAGLRWDRYDMDTWEVDKDSPGFNEQDFTISDESLKKAPARNILQPRLGLGFPVSDKTVFHLQYGKFAQMPDMQYVYARRGFMAVTFGGQNFIPSPFAFDLEPIETTQYEIGFSHQFTQFASFDVTAFYKNTQGQLEIVLQRTSPTAEAADYNTYVNGDFTTARGIELTLRSRRFGGFHTMVNYTLTDAKGTNSEPGGQVSSLENGTAPPSMITPLRFEQRHRGSVALDYRSPRDKGPLLSDWNINTLVTFNSGHKFTRSTGGLGQRAAFQGALLTDNDPRNRIPLEPLNSSSTPWYFNTDLQIEKGFSFGRIRASAYLYIENLFNRKHVVNVYRRTGDANNDGFLTSPELSQKIVEAQGQQYVDLYRAINLANRQHYMWDTGNDLFGAPRQVTLGLKVEL